MKIKLLLTLLIAMLCTTIYCQNPQTLNKTGSTEIELNEKVDGIGPLQGIVPFEYDNFKKGIILDAIMNGTIHLKAFFDTGSYGLALSPNFSKHKTDKKTDTPFKLQVGNWFYEQPSIGYLNNQFLFDFQGCNLLLGHVFFKGKIIEISFEHHYIRELENTEDLGCYDKIPFKLLNERNPVVKGKASIKGKTVEGEFIIDTCYNGTMKISSSLIKKYNISTKDDFEFKSVGITKNHKNVRSNADTIQIGCNYITNTIAFLETEDTTYFGRGIDGLIGNKFFDNFSVVLDLKNYYLYLKPIEK